MLISGLCRSAEFFRRIDPLSPTNRMMPKAFIHLVFAAMLAVIGGAAAAADPNTRAGHGLPAEASVSSSHGDRPIILAAASAPAAAAPAEDAAQEKPVDSGPIPLEENGLIAQILAQVDRWNDSFEIQVRQLARVLSGLPAILDGVGARLADSADQTLLLKGLLILASIFAVGLGMEWLLRRLFAGPRASFINHAQQLDRHIETSATSEVQARADTRPAAGPASGDAAGADAKQDQKEAGMQPPAEGLALVRSQRDGVDLVESIPIDTGRSSSAASIPGQAFETQSPGALQTGMSGQADAAAQAASYDKHESATRLASTKLWSLLRQLPFAIGVLLLDLLPLTVFFLVTAVALHWLGGSDMGLRQIVNILVGAYVGMRAATAVLRLVVAPAGCGIPILRVRADIADTLYQGLRRMIVTAAVGVALAGIVHGLGGAGEGRLVTLKFVSLVVHLQAVFLIFRLRPHVAALIAGSPGPDSALSTARKWLAETWATFATILVMGTWVVWALGVEDGFPRLLHFIGVTVGITLAARMLAILILGLLGRLFHGNVAAGRSPSGAAEGADRYFPLVQRVVVIFISLCTVVALLQAWGIDVTGWLMERPIGRRLFSAVLTIAVAVIVGIAVWEVANSTVERRLKIWKEQGETVRAARLRTLLPILRSCLFIVLILIVGLTALNEIGINTTPLLASASIVGVALGFGSQKLVQDFITGIFLLMENAMQVGDWVTVAGVSGVVEDLSIRTVRLRAGDGSLHIVPFSSVSTVNNTNRGLGNAVMRVSVAYGTDIDTVTSELREIGQNLRSDPNFAANIIGDLEIWGVDAVDGSSVTLAGQMRCTDKGRWGVQRELNRRILERFRQINVVIADPRATVLLSRDAPPPAVSAVQHLTPGGTRKPAPDAGLESAG